MGGHRTPVAPCTDSGALRAADDPAGARGSQSIYLLPSAPMHETEFVMTFINRHLANIVAIAFGLTAAVAGAVMLVYR